MPGCHAVAGSHPFAATRRYRLAIGGVLAVLAVLTVLTAVAGRTGTVRCARTLRTGCGT